MRALAVVFVLTGCVQTDFDPVTNPVDGPKGDGIGGDAWREDDITCESDADCHPGEACGDGVCQLVRCHGDAVETEAPLGAFVTLLSDRELLVADGLPQDGEYWIDGYPPKAGHVGYPESWKLGGNAVADMAGGNFLGVGGEQFAVATEGSPTIVLPSAELSVDAGGLPVALAAGDVDNDGTDELVVLLASGAALCELDGAAPSCAPIEAAGGEGIDVVVANVDGEEAPEVVFLVKISGDHVLDVWRPGKDLGRTILESKLDRLTAADLDGDGTDELVGFRDDDVGFWAHATVHAFAVDPDGATEFAQHEIHDSTVDIAAGDLDGDGAAELLAIRSDGDLEVLRPDERGFASVFVTELSVSQSPKRLALSDIDGDSVSGELVDGPRLVNGPVVPTVVVQFPPHSSDYSDGLPSVLIGRTEQIAESMTDTVTLSLGVDVGVGASFFDIFSGSVSTSIREELTRSRTEETSLAVGERFSLEPDTSRPGLQYGAVVVASGCFHAYDYDVQGEPMVVLVPAGGSTGVWSTPRYNAMAEALGDLPIIEINAVIGDPGSYPAKPQKLDGSGIASEDMVFEDPPELFVSDIGDVGWWLSAGQSTTLTEARKTTISLDASVGVAGVQFGAHVGEGFGQAYSLLVGEQALFGGSVPPMPDDIATPEDEHALNAFGFSPFVYREGYRRADGSEAGYYVLSFTVSP